MTSFEPTDSNSVEANGISLEIVNPNSILFSTRVYPIPKNELGATTNIEFTIRIINNTLNPIRLNPYPTFIPELLTADGQPLQKQIATAQSVTNSQTNENSSSKQQPHETRKLTQWEVKPQLPTTTSLTAKLSWHDNLLQLKIPTVPRCLLNANNIWCFNLIESASYQFRFILNTNHETTSIVESKRNEVKTAQPIRSGVIATPWVNLCLVQPVATDSSAIEIDGVQFKVEMPETVLTIPPQLPNAQTSVKLGIRVTNNTSAVLRFEQIGSVGFNLIDSEGKEIQFTEAQWRRWVGKGLEYYIVQPGESDIFVLDAMLSWYSSQLQLVIPNQAGGFYYFRGLKQGSYQIQAIYHTSERRANYLNEKGVENIWSGWIAMPFVKFYIV